MASDQGPQGDYRLGFNGPAHGLATLSIVGPLLALVFVGNRVYWRVKVLGRVWYDDWAILLAMVRHADVLLDTPANI